jgi:hypothetical protein
MEPLPTMFREDSGRKKIMRRRQRPERMVRNQKIQVQLVE